ncbi:hypothetical protein DPV78_011294 [Talaromyces pinophilus]|nr:hypothetical protein DPV78_011294 [Talaromyces pinophilus]
MRLQLTILRHGLPATRILWTVRSQNSHPISTSAIASTRLPNAAYGNEGCTIAQLLEDINEVVPLETAVEAVGENEDTGGQWGLEDYVVEVNGFECLHFMSVDGLLREGDEVMIRALEVGDIRARRLAGRLQVSTDGRRLIDGVPFGRPYLQKSYSSRPPIRIPPRKRRRTTLSSWTGNLEDEQTDTQLALYDDVSVMDSEHGTVIRHPRTLFDEGDDDEDDMDYEEDTEELAEELKSLRDDAQADVPFFETPDFKRFRAGRMSRMAHRDPLPSSSPARPSVVSTPRTTLTKGVDGEASVKSTKSVHFEADISNFESQLSESDSESDEDVVSEANSAASSDTDDSSLESSDESPASEESEIESESESESEDEDLPQKKKPKAIDVFTPPGEGNRKTRNSNRRKKLRSRLAKLKSLGELPPEANFDDLKRWQAKNGKAPLTEVTDLGGKRETKSKEQSEIEIKRQQLLRDLASGGVDIDGHSEKENIPPRYRNGKQRDVQESPEKAKDSPATTVTLEAAAETPADEPARTSPAEVKRRKLDLSSTKRLLFGSLGVRTPKTKEDEEALRTKLDATRTKPVAPEKPEEETVEVEKEKDVDENWQDKIVLNATECFYDDVELTAPPFPFQQRWDSAANYAIRQRKNNNNKNKKRKQREWQEEEVYESYQDNTLNYNDAEGDITLNYDEPVSAQEEAAIQKEATTQKGAQVTNVDSDPDDLPELPSDITALPVITDKEVTVGSIIAFKQLFMSKATNWQPQISDYKVARVDKIHENGTLDMILAKRDREVSEQTEVDEDGVRTYSGFEMPGDEHEVEDDGVRSVTFADLLEPKMIKAIVKEPDQSQQSQKEDTLANGDGNDETSSLNHPPPSVPVISAGSNAASVDEADDKDGEKDDDELPPPLAAPSSQTRLEISHIIHDAGFRSTMDSELGKEPLLLEMFDQKPREDSAIEMQSKAASTGDKSSDSNSEEFASSPPDVGDQHDVAEESQMVDNGDNMAMDMDDVGFQMDADDDFVMNDQNSQADDDSDDGVPLPRNDAAKRHEKELTTNEKVSSMAGEKPASQPSRKISSQIVKQEPSQKVETGRGEADKSFVSTTVSANTRSFTEPAVLDNGGYDDDDDDAPSEYSDAYSTVPNPFYERDAAAMKKEKAKATNKGPGSSQQDHPAETPSSNMPKSNQEANNVTEYTPESTEKKTTNNKIEFDLGFLDDNREESEDSDVDFPDIEVLWASTAPTQKEFPPIKIEAASQMPNSTADREASLPSLRQPSVHDSAGNELATAAKDTPTVAQQEQPEPSQQQAIIDSSSRRETQEPINNDNNANNETQSPSPFLPDIDFGGSQQDTNDNADIDLDDDDQYQHSADNSSHPDFQPQDQQEDSQDHSIPMVDLTVSSPLVSPDDSEDEDFAKSQGLPRGPGWVKKNVPVTRRQTRSSTGGGIVLSSSLSPQPVRRRGRRLTQSQY